jgi:hypothetical protein
MLEKRKPIRLKISEGFGPWDLKKMLFQLNDLEKNPPVKSVEKNGTEFLVTLNDYPVAAAAVIGLAAERDGLDVVRDR